MVMLSLWGVFGAYMLFACCFVVCCMLRTFVVNLDYRLLCYGGYLIAQ